MKDARIYKKTFRSAWRNIGEHTVAIMLDDYNELDELGGVERNETVVYFNETASAIWNLTDGKNSVNDIVSRLESRFSAKDKTLIYTDVLNILNEFKKLGLIEENGSKSQDR